jgi:hypothetical protein
MLQRILFFHYKNTFLWSGAQHMSGLFGIQATRQLVEVEVTLRLIVSQSVCLGIDYPCGTYVQILFPIGMLLSEICGLVFGGGALSDERTGLQFAV